MEEHSRKTQRVKKAEHETAESKYLRQGRISRRQPQKAPLAGCSMWGLVRTVSAGQHGRWQLSCAVRWDGSEQGQVRAFMGIGEGRWVVREDPVHSYILLFGGR